MKRLFLTCLIGLLLITAASKLSLDAAAVKTACAMCGKPVHLKLKTDIAMGSLYQSFCCPHCAIMSLTLQPGKAAEAKVTVTDYQTGKTLPATNAIFVLDTGSVLCCAPAILAFTAQSGAEAYGKGNILTWPEVIAQMTARKKAN